MQDYNNSMFDIFFYILIFLTNDVRPWLLLVAKHEMRNVKGTLTLTIVFILIFIFSSAHVLLLLPVYSIYGR